MLNKMSKMLLFCLAYLPLFISVAIRSYFSLTTIIIIFVLLLLNVLLVTLLLRSIKTIVPSKEKIQITELRNSEYLTFIVTYLIPFYGFNIDTPTIISSLIIISIISFIYIDTPLFCINPLLKVIFKYNLYEMRIGSARGYMLSKSKLSYKSYYIQLYKLGENIYLGEEINEGYNSRNT